MPLHHLTKRVINMKDYSIATYVNTDLLYKISRVMILYVKKKPWSSPVTFYAQIAQQYQHLNQLLMLVVPHSLINVRHVPHLLKQEYYLYDSTLFGHLALLTLPRNKLDMLRLQPLLVGNELLLL